MITEEDIAQMLSDLTIACQKQVWGSFFPDEGPYARSHFPKHIEFIESTSRFPVCTLFGANRSGKSMLLSYMVACWAMGKYPHWWKGRRFEKPVKIWVAGQTTELVKGSTMEYLFGANGVLGMIDADHIEHIFFNQQVPGLINRVLVRREGGGLSEITFKTYDQGWQRFQSGTVDVVLLDEEMPARIFSESVTRTATTNGIVLVGFTGLQGITPLVAHLWPQSVGLDKTEEETHRYHCFIGWKDIPYSLLPEQRRKELIAQYLPNEVRARTEGIPSVGSGMVYPVAEEEFVVEPFEIPAHWRKGFALDPGYRSKTAALWAAWDEDSDTIYLYSEHYQGLAEPTVHVDAMRRRGSWIPCLIDPAGANINDGKRVKHVYKETMQVVNEDWQIFDAQKSITAGIMEVYSRLTSGRLKVFNTLRSWLMEFRQYHRDDTGKIAPTPDHLMDDTRYIVLGTAKFITKPVEVNKRVAKMQEVNPFRL